MSFQHYWAAVFNDSSSKISYSQMPLLLSSPEYVWDWFVDVFLLSFGLDNYQTCLQGDYSSSTSWLIISCTISLFLFFVSNKKWKLFFSFFLFCHSFLCLNRASPFLSFATFCFLLSLHISLSLSFYFVFYISCDLVQFNAFIVWICPTNVLSVHVFLKECFECTVYLSVAVVLSLSVCLSLSYCLFPILRKYI